MMIKLHNTGTRGQCEGPRFQASWGLIVSRHAEFAKYLKWLFKNGEWRDVETNGNLVALSGARQLLASLIDESRPLTAALAT